MAESAGNAHGRVRPRRTRRSGSAFVEINASSPARSSVEALPISPANIEAALTKSSYPFGLSRGLGAGGRIRTIKARTRSTKRTPKASNRFRVLGDMPFTLLMHDNGSSQFPSPWWRFQSFKSTAVKIGQLLLCSRASLRQPPRARPIGSSPKSARFQADLYEREKIYGRAPIAESQRAVGSRLRIGELENLLIPAHAERDNNFQFDCLTISGTVLEKSHKPVMIGRQAL